MNRMEVASDGKTPYERARGKRVEVIGLEFGEKVMWKFHPGRKMEKLNARWGQGIFLGVRSKSGEVVVADSETREIHYTRTVRRVPREQRWVAENIALVTVVPWNRGKDDPEADGYQPYFDVRSGPGRRLTDEDKKSIATDDAERTVHPAHLWKRHFEKHGFTDRCSGCSSILRGISLQPHSRECRKIMEDALASDARIKNAWIRMREQARKRGVTGGDEEGEE